jgi:hypothetical protein
VGACPCSRKRRSVRRWRVGSLIAGKPRTVATDLIGAVSGNSTPSSRYKALSDILYVAEHATTSEVKKQAETTAKMLICATELTFLNNYGDKNGSIIWSDFTKSVADALGQPAQ